MTEARAVAPVAAPAGGDDAASAPLWTPPPRGDLTHGPLQAALFRLAGPAILAKALHALLALVDVFWVARLGAAPTAAVTTSFFASWILLAATDLTALGILAHVARHTGAGDRARAAHAASQGLLLGLGLGTLLAALAWAATPALFRALGTEPAVAASGTVYMRLLFVAAPLTYTYINCEFVMRAAGDTRTPMLITGGMVLLNAVLDPFLIYGIGPFPRLEVLGAALATVLAQVVAVAAFAWRAAVRDRAMPLVRASLRRLDPRLARSLLAIGFPGMAIGVFYSLIYLFMSGIAARLGTVALAVLGLANRAESVTYLVVTGFAAATATMVGQNLGARRPDRAARAAWSSALWMGLYGVLVGGVLVAAPRQVLGLFTSDPEVLDLGGPYLRILGYAQPLMALEIVFEHAFSGAGDNVPPMAISVPMNALRVPLLLWVVHDLGAGLLGIAWVLAITCMVRGLLAALWFRRGGWKARRL
jgi:putative MATE family efflux protein